MRQLLLGLVRTRRPIALVTLALVPAMMLLTAAPLHAQGGGASQTGSINGKVTDDTGAGLPGVTVSATSSALMGVQTTTTNEQGLYRFPAIPPGTYALTYELTGFTTTKREAVGVTLGFTASVHIEMGVATVQEAVLVTAEAPLVDVTTTRVQQNFTLQQLQSIPNARDMWSLLGVSPAVVMSRIDVGGNRAGTQTGYTAYGYSGQTRVLVEGINTTEGTSGAGFYFDYGSFEEVFLGTAGQGAEMPNPGVQSQFLGKSGGNNFQGEVYYDYENNDLQGSNIGDDLLTRFPDLKAGSNEIQGYRDVSLNVGGPIQKDRVWWYASYRNQENKVAQPNFLFPKTFDTKLWNLSGKGTYQLSRNNKFVGYYQWGQKTQPNRLPFSAYKYPSEAETLYQSSGSWIYKGEWNGTIGNNMYVESRYGDFGYYFPLVANSEGTYYRRDTGASTLQGGDQKQQLDRDRRQFTTAMTVFKDNFLRGSHSLKVGGEVLLETSWDGYLQRYDGHIGHVFNNGVAQQVTFDFPTALAVNGNGLRDGLLSMAKLDHSNLFASDTYQVGRATLNLGLRYDRYKSHIPEQRQLAFTNGPVSIQDQTFPAQTFLVWNSVVPRAGLVYDLTGTGKTVLKFNYGLYRHNPGVGVASSANPNQSAKTITYGWNDRNSDGRYQLGEETSVSSTALAGTISVDPNIKQPYSHEVTTFLERQFTGTLAGRIGYVYKTNDDLWQTYQPFRPIESYSQPFSFADIGIDGVRGSADDQTLTYFGVPSGRVSEFPVTNVIMNVPSFGRYKTIETSISKRPSDRWSLQAGFGFTWLHDFPSNYPNNPNSPLDEHYTRWDFKMAGSYDGPWGIRFSPVLRHQAGANFARTLSVSAPSGSGAFLGSTTVYAEPYDSQRQDNITVLDLRTEKSVSLRGSMRVRLFVDVFNITNSVAAETISVATGSAYLQPTALLAPRVARVGFRFVW